MEIQRGYSDAPGARFVTKGWGSERWIVNTSDYCGKVLTVLKGKECSWHYHKNKEETFLVVAGNLRVWISEGDDEAAAEMMVLSAGHSLHLLPGTRHRFRGITDVTLVEFSTHHEDSDSIRISEGDVEAKEDFKCRECGTKYVQAFCSTSDVSICLWCSGEEEDSGILE